MPRNTYAFAPIILLVATACGGGDGEESDATLNGKFVDSAVVGLHFSTATQSGLTTTDGTFKYLAGETVTFAVGGVTLGSAAGAAQITPFDLAGVTPPTTAVAIKALVKDPYTLTPFERVMNISSFLVALDSDEDPSNGIDLTGDDAALADATLSFDHEPYRFSSDYLVPLLGTTNTGRINRAPADGIAHLYASLGIAVADKVVASQTYEQHVDGTPDSIATTVYDAAGNATRDTQDYDGGGVLDVVTTRTFNASRQITSTTQDTDPVSAGVFHQHAVQTPTFDARGLPAQEVKVVTVDGAPVSTETHTQTFSPSGAVLVDRNETKYPGVAESYVNTITSVYNAHNLPTSTINEESTEPGAVPASRYVNTSTYDDAGNLLVVSYASFKVSDGSVVNRASRTRTYDASGRALTAIIDFAKGDNVLRERISITVTYDANGFVTKRVDKDDVDGDKIFDNTKTTTYAYDGSRRLISETQDEDAPGGTSVDGRLTTTYLYDTSGFVTERRESYDPDGPGAAPLASMNVTTSTYDADGNVLTEHVEIDNDGDGTFESSSETTYVYTAAADGVRSAVNERAFFPPQLLDVLL